MSAVSSSLLTLKPHGHPPGTPPCSTRRRLHRRLLCWGPAGPVLPLGVAPESTLRRELDLSLPRFLPRFPGKTLPRRRACGRTRTLQSLVLQASVCSSLSVSCSNSADFAFSSCVTVRTGLRRGVWLQSQGQAFARLPGTLGQLMPRAEAPALPRCSFLPRSRLSCAFSRLFGGAHSHRLQ